VFEGGRAKEKARGLDETWMLHHNNVLAHTLLLNREFMVKHETIVIHQLPYSPYWHLQASVPAVR
jgi:hypothetical protein